MGGIAPIGDISREIPVFSADSRVTSTWISAHAGCGKTHALVSRVMRLLLLGVPPERICCITYTRAAAAEMHERVIMEVRTLLLAGDADCMKKVTAFLGRKPQPAELARARTLFSQVLDSTTGGIELTTIHGFCQRLLRAFPIEAGVAPYFTVLDEAESALLTHRACQRLLDTDDDADLVQALKLVAERAPEHRFQAFARDILQRRAWWSHIWNRQPPEILKERLYALHGLSLEADEAVWVAEYAALPSADDAAVIRRELPRLAAHKNKHEKKIAAVLAAWLATDAEARSAQISAMIDLWLTKTELTPRAKLVNEKDFPAGSPIRDVFDRLTAASVTLVAQRGALACAQESYALAVVARALLGHYAQLKAERTALDYEDLIARTVELLTTREMTAWVMTKLDHRIDHVLVDEAQDTSTGQWQIARALVEELVASSQGVGSAGIPRSLLVVGDEKQSIFSFQGAKPELFARQRSVFSGLLQHSAAPLVAETLVRSRRSAPAVLKYVDAVAALPDIASSLAASAHVEPHATSRTDAAGSVTLYPLVEGEEKTSLPPFTIPVSYQITKSAPQELAEVIARTIRHWLDEGRMLANEGRAVTAGDILILVHRRKPVVPCLIRALERNDIPVAGIDRLVLAEHLAVKDLLALIAWVGFTGDDLSLAQVLRSPLIGLSEDEVLALAHARGDVSLWDRLRTSRHTEAAAVLSHWLAQRHAIPYEFLTDVLEVKDARRRFAARFGEEVHEVLDEMKAQASHLPLVPNLANLAMFLTTNNHSVKREQESAIADQVRIMTVHGAKGLEAPVVILADTIRPPSLQREQMYELSDADGQVFPVTRLTERARHAPVFEQARIARLAALQQEYHRLLYVALTRAKDELHLFGAASKAPEESWYAIFAQALQALPAEKRDDGSVRFADATAPHVPKKAAAVPAVDPLPAWTNPLLHYPLRPVTLAPSKLTASVPAPFVRYASEQAKERGVRIHRILQFLQVHSTRAQLASLVRIVAPDWDKATRAAIEEEIWDLFQREHWLWEHASAAEVSIGGDIDVDGVMTPFHGQIDRLVRTPEGLVILDYKTSHAVPENPSGVLRNYLLQLKAYAALLRRMEPGIPMKTAIVWTARPLLMDVTDAVAAEAWQEKDSFPEVTGPSPFAA